MGLGKRELIKGDEKRGKVRGLSPTLSLDIIHLEKKKAFLEKSFCSYCEEFFALF